MFWVHSVLFLINCACNAIVYRPLEINDYEKGFLQLLNHHEDGNIISKEQFIEIFENKSNRNIHTFVAVDTKDDDLIVGTISICLIQKYNKNGAYKGYIQNAAVMNCKKRNGVGVALLKKIYEFIADKEVYKLVVVTPRKNISFYKKLGFNEQNIVFEQYLEYSTDKK